MAVVVAVLEMDEITVSVVDLEPEEPDLLLVEEPDGLVVMELPPLPLAAASSA